MKLFVKTIIGLLGLYFFCTLFIPNIVDEKFNKVHHQGIGAISSEAELVFNRLDFIADLHCDALLWKRNLNKENDFGHVDIPKLIKGNVALQAFTIVSKVPYGINFQSNKTSSDMLQIHSFAVGRNPKTWFSPKARVLSQCKELQKFADRSKGEFRILYSSEDLQQYLNDRTSRPNISAGFLGIEGMQGLEGDIKNVELFYQAGVRMMSPTHFQDNEVGGSAHGESHAGLSDFGKEVLKEIEKRNIILDVSHSSPKLLDEILKLYQKPVITSHTGVQGTCPSPRNLSDQHLKAIAKSGGLIGIALFEGAVCGKSLSATAEAMKYTIRLVGAEHVALGSDFDGAVETPIDITEFKHLVDAMLKVGLSEREIRLVMGENVKKFWLENQ